MFSLILVEAALETVPPSIQHHPSVRRDAKRRGKRPTETLLDRSLHHEAMKGLTNSQKRGRPDIVHFCLLEALGAPLNLEGGLRVWVHTVGGYAIEIAPEARLPRTSPRFNSLMEQLFTEGRVPPGGGAPLMSLNRIGLENLLYGIGASPVIALTSHGKPTCFEELCKGLAGAENPAVLIGAYPSGPMEDETLSLADEAASIYHEPLEAWVVTSRLIYEFERASRSVSGTGKK
jgi:rRNA small subunit pseudouridine methyltransferase Nep1